MEPAVDPFHPLLRILDRYRADVHHLRPGAPERTVDDPHGPPIPQSLRTFLLRWNGAVLFRGVLRVRAVVDIASASHDAPNVWLFADGPKDEQWGYAAVSGGWHFGRWDGKRLTALHEHFGRWLHAQARILDEDRREGLSQIEMRLETDPECGLLHFQRGEYLLGEGDAGGALGAFRRATALAPDHATAWQRMGEALLATDHAAARHALIMALRSTTLPLPYSGAPAMDASTLRVMESLFPADDVGWERELHHLIHERSQGLSDPDAARLYEAAALGLARVHIARKERPQARQALQFARDRALSMPGGAAPLNRLSGLLLAMVDLDTDLGDHEDAEDTLRRLKAHDDEEVRARVRVYFNRLRIVPTLSGTMDDLARMDTCARAACRELTSLLQLVCENNYMRAKREMWCRGTERALSGRSALKGLVDTEAADAEPVDPVAAGVAEGDDKAKEGGEEAAAAAAAAAEQAAVGAGMLHDGGDEAAASVSVVKEVIALGDALLKQMLAGSRAYGLMYGSKRLFSTLCKSKQGDVATLTAVLRSLSEFVMSSEEVEAADVNPDEEREGTAAEAVQAAREKAIGASKQSRRRLNLAIWALVMQAFDYVVEEDALQDRFLELDVTRRATRQPWMAAVCGGLACAVCLRVAGVCVLEACERALRVGAEQRAKGRTALARARAGRARQPCRGAAVYGVQRDGGARGWRRCERRRWRRWRDGHGRR